ncbi:hypothetical protein M8818_007505 [Zalaria obscura]|uniref:Uncharacterized protein n=1 Tax=Zalaria obscura TaxID=2024903 RepID=A0ACC3S4G7_9PEZI
MTGASRELASKVIVMAQKRRFGTTTKRSVAPLGNVLKALLQDSPQRLSRGFWSHYTCRNLPDSGTLTLRGHFACEKPCTEPAEMSGVAHVAIANINREL